MISKRKNSTNPSVTFFIIIVPDIVCCEASCNNYRNNSPKQRAVCSNFAPNGYIGAKNWTLTFFPRTFRAPPGYPGQNPRMSRRKVCLPWVSRHFPNYLLEPLHMEDPHPTGRLGPGGASSLCCVVSCLFVIDWYVHFGVNSSCTARIT